MNKFPKAPRSPEPERESRSILLGVLWVFLFLGALIPGAPQLLQYGICFLGAGLLLILAPPKAALPRCWIYLAIAFLIAGLTSFLPASWFPYPSWRTHLDELGVKTGPLVTIQWQGAIEQYAILALILITGLWIGSQRASAKQLRNIALIFTVGVAAYALMSQGLRDFMASGRSYGHFGFFPNRNQTGTYLAMGAICGLGLSLHSVQHKQVTRAVIAGLSSAICLWAIFSWSISRAGVALFAIAFALWLLLLGRKYWSPNLLKGVGLLILLLVGLYLVSESRVKDRLSSTIQEVVKVGDDSFSNKVSMDRVSELDGRTLIILDTLRMIRSAPLTGVGAGQFRYVFPQFENRAAFNNDLVCFHPESDWLWIAADLGLPAMLILLTLVGIAFFHAFKNVRSGRDRALRMACLVAAVIVPLHGNLDVPGHRPVLAWTSIFLFMLSLNPSGPADISAKLRWAFRGIGFLFILVGIFLFAGPLLGFKPPSLIRAQEAVRSGASLYQETIHLSSAGSAPIRKRIHLLARESLEVAPLEQSLYRLDGFALIPDEENRADANRILAIERALAPVRVNIPLVQAKEYSSYDAVLTASLWKETMKRARWMDLNHPGSRFSRERIATAIQIQARKLPFLRASAEEIIKESGKP